MINNKYHNLNKQIIKKLQNFATKNDIDIICFKQEGKVSTFSFIESGNKITLEIDNTQYEENNE